MPSFSYSWRTTRSLWVAAVLLPLVAACSFDGLPGVTTSVAPQSAVSDTTPDDFVAPMGYAEEPPPVSSSGMNASIGRYSALYGVPESLIRRIIVRESSYNARARHGAYWGLMQIRYDTARSMGYDGSPDGLLDADTNLRYAVRYLAGAYKVAGGDPEKAVSFYASGYYYDARRMGLLEEVGLKRGK